MLMAVSYMWGRCGFVGVRRMVPTFGDGQRFGRVEVQHERFVTGNGSNAGMGLGNHSGRAREEPTPRSQPMVLQHKANFRQLRHDVRV